MLTVGSHSVSVCVAPLLALARKRQVLSTELRDVTHSEL